jgi:triosephosphate isomerase
MSRPILFAANWKMHLHPGEARTYLQEFLRLDQPRDGRSVTFFPSAVSIEAVATTLEGHEQLSVGVQDVDWEPKGAFTGATSVALARGAGAASALIGHSERRHVYGETDEATARKVAAVLAGGLQAVLCVGEKLEEREAGQTSAVVLRQLRAALDGVSAHADLVIAYEPVWAIGTGLTPTPGDVAEVHKMIRNYLISKNKAEGPQVRILYGGSVKPQNAKELMAVANVNGALVGGASLKAADFLGIAAAYA